MRYSKGSALAEDQTQWLIYPVQNEIGNSGEIALSLFPKSNFYILLSFEFTGILGSHDKSVEVKRYKKCIFLVAMKLISYPRSLSEDRRG